MPEIPLTSPAIPQSSDDIIDFFGQDDDKNQPPALPGEGEAKRREVKKDEKVIEDPIEEGGEEEIELKDPDEEKEKLKLEDKEEDDKIEIDAPPRKREILAVYPDVFKKFPFLEKMLYRDKEYTELFGSFDDAKEIAEKAEVFTNFENQLLSGDTAEILKNLKETDSKAFDKIVDNYLQTLGKVDKEAYFDVVNNINKRLIMEMVKTANEDDNDELKQAALIVNQYLFGSNKFTPPKARAEAQQSNENTEAERERLSFIQERFETSRDDLQGRVDNILKNTISEYIDPKNTMTAYVKKNAIADALKDLHLSVGNDTGMRRNLDKLWKAAFDSKFSKESLGKIQSFYLGRAKQTLPSAIRKARAEALKDLAPRISKDEQEEKEETTSSQQASRRIIPPGRPSQPKKSELQKGESVTEFFMRD